MPFDFPANPPAGTTHEQFGVEYVWDGSVWNLVGGGAMTDYVLKAGDTMTGPLIVQADPAKGSVSLRLPNGAEPGHIEFKNGDGTRKAYIGAGSGTAFDLLLDNATSLNLRGGNIFMQDAGGIHWGSNSAVSDPLDMSKGLCLYGYAGPSQFGFTITSGTLNYVVQNTGNMHIFRVGAEEVMSVKSDGVRIPGGNLNVTGTITASGEIRGQDIFATRNLHATGNLDVDGTSDFVGAARIPLTTNKMIQNPVTAGANGYFIGDSFHGICFDGATKLQIVEYHGIFEFVKRTTGTTGGTVQASFNNGNLTCNAATIGGALNINGGAIVPESEHIQIGQSGDRSIGGGDGNGGIVHRVKGADNHKFFVGSTQEFTINSNGGSLLGSLEADGFIDRATGLDLIAEIKALKAEVATLRGRG